MTPFEYAISKIGEHEKSGPDQDNPFVVECLRRCGLPSGMLHDETPWCAAFVGRCLQEGHAKPGRLWTAAATRYMDYGEPTLEPKEGDLAVFWRITSAGTRGGHVGFFVEKNGTHIRVLGGNQNNRVGYKYYPRTHVLGYRTYG